MGNARPRPRIDLPTGWQSFTPERKQALRDLLRMAKFRRTYRYDPAAFVVDCINWDRVPRSDGPHEYQLEILSELIEHGREAARGPHGIGKTAIAAWAVHWFALTRDGDSWKAPTTASKWGQLEKFLWPEIHEWARYLRWDLIGRDPYNEVHELQVLNLNLHTGAAFAIASNQPAAIEGAHADHVLYIYDEAKTISKETFDATEGAFAGAGVDTGREALALAISTPGEPQGRFYQIHNRDAGLLHWHTRHVTKEEAIDAGRMSRQWAETMAEQWASDPAVYENRVEGNFAVGSTTSVIPLRWVEDAVERWKAMAVQSLKDKTWEIPDDALPSFTCAGVDIADEGGDMNCLAERHGNVIVRLRRWAGIDTMQTTGRVRAVVRGKGDRGYVIIDSIGVGAGATARLREQKVRTIGFVAGESSGKTDSTGEFEFANKRAEAWWGMRERLDPSQPGGSKICLPPDDLMIGDLTAPKWRETSSGKILVESKDDIRARIGRSTDTGDAVVQSFVAVPPPPTATSARGHRIPGR